MELILRSNFNFSCLKHIPEAATSFTSTPFSWAIKPSTEKITNPANILVAQLMIGTKNESLKYNLDHSGEFVSVIHEHLFCLFKMDRIGDACFPLKETITEWNQYKADRRCLCISFSIHFE